MNTQTKIETPLWQINVLLFVVLAAFHILIGSKPQHDSYAVMQIATYMNISTLTVNRVFAIFLVIGIPFSIKLVWNRFFTKLPNIQHIGYWHGFMCLLILEILNAYFR